jgi:hypothetical protein
MVLLLRDGDRILSADLSGYKMAIYTGIESNTLNINKGFIVLSG